jgi:hypothetical protein
MAKKESIDLMMTPICVLQAHLGLDATADAGKAIDRTPSHTRRGCQTVEAASRLAAAPMAKEESIGLTMTCAGDFSIEIGLD